MSETDHIKLPYTSSKTFKVISTKSFDEFIKLNRQQALDSYRTALKKNIEEMDKWDSSPDFRTGYDEAMRDIIKLIDHTTIEK